ncbi:MAG: 50S ribosomal protein L25 [Deltaproteobacteria bacterium ADurb.Bin151]|jgi:large subunit ribosomal protein L25|nr:50S ribosomal protein L25/general stress protein Ctc [Smithella sp.]OQB56877.1 MAG: 50S ribosomal protein L25 [Deltaproteobacteria bacterium ADurb.Bin151]HNZ10647.1 50S ribosomal protein L25/general stress protein Ctc [Smithellaceae bacterium]HOG81310.1 50S ribosomal protein L25/general stress protein Ctc [Smithellaceae bacterium]HOQ42912.1 50S ribosomal protein L25/general stress protein Ctc [Smithellaceae bacterium]
MEITDLTAQVRKEQKKGPARRLRQQGLVPAIFYGGSTENIPLTVKSADLLKLHKEKKDHAFIKLIIDDGGKKVEKLSLIKELQVQPLTGILYHADFYEVDMKKKLVFDVSLNFTGKAIGVENGGELQHIKRDIKVLCLPSDLPDHIDVDITPIEIGHSIKVKDIQLPENLTHLDPPEAAVVSVAAVKVVKVEAAAEEAPVEGATTAAAEPAKEEKKEKEK